jgi:hypothetical protein
LICGHLNIALLSHATYRINLIVRLSKTILAISLKLLGQSRISGSALSIKAKPNHLRLWLRGFGSAAGQRRARKQNTPKTQLHTFPPA